MSRRFLTVATALCLFGLGACSEGGSTPASSSVGTPAPGATRTPMAAPVVAGLLTPAPGSIYFGAYVNSSGLLGGDTPAAAATFEAQINRTLALHMQYLSFYASFASNRILDDYTHYRIPVISWNCQYPDAQIAPAAGETTGTYDAAIATAAQEAKGFGGPMFVRYLWDPNLPSTAMAGSRSGCWDKNTDLPNQQFSPTEYIAAWQHIHNIFAQVGATNVIWLWTVNSNAPSTAPSPMAYYPGSQYVDWVGMDDYDLTSASFDATFSGLYSSLATLNKPMMISETGALGGAQQAFFSSAASTLQTQLPLVQAFLYYDGIDYVTADNQDWRVTTAALPTFTTFANSPYMAATYAP